jgi:hypothetical protein
MMWKMRSKTVFKPFVSSNGNEYELEIKPTEWTRISLIEKFVEDVHGTVTAEPTDWKWEGLAAMTHDLRLTIVGWRSESLN